MAKRGETSITITSQVVNNPAAGNVENSLNIGGVIISPVGPDVDIVYGQLDLLTKFTKEGVIPRNADQSLINAYYLAQFMPLVIARSVGVNFKGGVSLYSKKGLVKQLFDENNTPLIYSKTGQTLELPALNATASDFQLADFNILIEDVMIYKGSEVPEVESDILLIEVETLEDFKSALSKVGGFSFYNFEQGKSESTITLTFDILSSEQSLSYGNAETGNTLSTLPEESNVTLTRDSNLGDDPGEIVFSIINKYCEANDLLEINLTFTPNSGSTGGTGTIEFLDSYNEGTYSFSLDPDDSNYIETLNDLDLSVIIALGNTDQTITEAEESNFEFGAATGYSNNLGLESSAILTALSKLESQELYQIDGLCTFGLQNNSNGASIAAKFATCAANNFWFVPIGAPRTLTNRRLIKQWFNAAGLPDPDPVPSSMALGCFDRNTSLLDWTVYIDPGCKYWERVYSNRGLGKEFAPVFKETNGALNLSDPVLLLSKEDREILLNNSHPINWPVYNPRTSIYYLNQNWSWQLSTTENIVEEENIARQFLKINRDVKTIMNQFFSRYNTRSTRANVQDVLDYYMRWNIMNQDYSPIEYRITCDTTNNTDEVIRAHELKVLLEVRYQGSIKWITVINRGYPVGVHFSMEM